MKYFKNVLTIMLCCVAIAVSSISAEAFSAPMDVSTTVQTFELEDGSVITVIEELYVESSARSNTKTGTKTKTYKDNGETIAVITLKATFNYTGSSVGVVSKQVSNASTYNGWNFSQTYLGANGGTVSLAGILTKLSETSVDVAMSITCDVNGNIT